MLQKLILLSLDFFINFTAWICLGLVGSFLTDVVGVEINIRPFIIFVSTLSIFYCNLFSIIYNRIQRCIWICIIGILAEILAVLLFCLYGDLWLFVNLDIIDALVIILITVFSIFIFVFIFFALVLSGYINIVLLGLKYKIAFRYFYIIKIITGVAANYAMFYLLLEDPSNYNNKFISFIINIFISLTILWASYKTIHINKKTHVFLKSFKNFAIVICSWGSPSFYNQDISQIDFRKKNLAHYDIRAKKLYRTCFQGVTGLERARVDSRYLDLENPKVQQLLTQAYSEDKDFSNINLKGAYLQNTEMRGFDLTDAELTGADLKSADLRGSLLIRTQLVGVDFTGANLTGCCIKDWSVNDQTNFTEVECDYVYLDVDEQGQATRRSPVDRNFEPREFESLYQQVEEVIELIFKEGENWKAVAFGLDKLQLENEDLGLQLKGIERRGDRLVVKVSYNGDYPREQVERQLNAVVTEMKHQLAAKEEQIRFLMGITSEQTMTIKNQSTALSNFSQKPFGNHFTITGGTISNISGSGKIEYTEVFNQLRNLVRENNPAEASTLAESFLQQLASETAPGEDPQTSQIEKFLLAEAEQENSFRKFLMEQGQQIVDNLPEGAISIAFRNAIAHLRSESMNS
ncbi:pentapeptide repeat-containing protein [Limnoraphis robusta Tam1]|uniref:Pentapeptide repeat-containing protein n=1 Tax=Limnoraphis robusta CCNP1315 TaxID=3110306 RepID=A0ABU5TYH7_9CYAN|nr:pentapeptide repeat-containing protein [Limnoraphis robusta]MEA5495958.1 pentapeptide repeat-containing protein [Limnoraphis robusta BA-68 BA1]MEA5519986.1 pentapeptide repeat-containing protein [Limnoraphis robusta CCNP1315]MEA5540767.1 pentapeptide repeat-containing protein [Limnoraphis robusta Tam1]MEA5544908.1 pentapeptide repeat-containing protein [Limnoraphis robusta CCNP1324]